MYKIWQEKQYLSHYRIIVWPYIKRSVLLVDILYLLITQSKRTWVNWFGFRNKRFKMIFLARIKLSKNLVQICIIYWSNSFVYVRSIIIISCKETLPTISPLQEAQVMHPSAAETLREDGTVFASFAQCFTVLRIISRIWGGNWGTIPWIKYWQPLNHSHRWQNCSCRLESKNNGKSSTFCWCEVFETWNFVANAKIINSSAERGAVKLNVHILASTYSGVRVWPGSWDLWLWHLGLHCNKKHLVIDFIQFITLKG